MAPLNGPGVHEVLNVIYINIPYTDSQLAVYEFHYLADAGELGTRPEIRDHKYHYQCRSRLLSLACVIEL